MTPLQFQKKVLDFYAKNGRSFPWRRTKDPYHILVSEIMLQQTQTHRVVPKYEEFLKKFPTIISLASAPLADVLRVWQGLGYNRRALYLQRTAKAVTANYGGQIPSSISKLLALPGIGPYTAGAIMAFAHNKPVVIIETNIRAAVLHDFFAHSAKVSDEKLKPILVRALPKTNTRRWYQALMDYGAFIKQKYGNPCRRSARHAKQSAFAGSDREIRGQVIGALANTAGMSKDALSKKISGEPFRQNKILKKLVAEGLISISRGTVKITQS